MSTTYYEIFVPKGGMITLPPEFDDTEVIVRKKPQPLPENNEHWTKKKTLEELRQEQGDKRMLDPDRYFGSLSFLWDSPEEVDEFLMRRKQ
jgi:hypothetical protein